MALSGFLHRLSCPEYKNWMKAGHCLSLIQDGLHGYIDAEMREFHMRLAIWLPEARGCRCRSNGNQFHPKCSACKEWMKAIVEYHNNREIHWGNCDPSRWPKDYWELAKVYLPRGHANSKGSQKCDAAALLNLINACKHFKDLNLSKVKEVIKYRNDLMHSSNMNVSSSWLENFGQKVKELISEFGHVPELQKKSDEIHEVLKSDWSVNDFTVHEVDGPGVESSENFYLRNTSLNELEIELLTQLLEELYLQKEDGPLSDEDKAAISNMKTFLTQNNDLLSVFKEDLEKLECLLN